METWRRTDVLQGGLEDEQVDFIELVNDTVTSLIRLEVCQFVPRPRLKTYLGLFLSDLLYDLLSFCIVYDWLHIRFRIVHLTQNGHFPCIRFADNEDAKLRTLGTDCCCV